MIIRTTVGGAVLRAVGCFADDAAMHRLSAEGALLAFDFTALDSFAAKLAVAEMHASIDAAIDDSEDAGMTEAFRLLKRSVQDLEAEYQRELSPPVEVETAPDAVVVDTGSHPTSTGDAAISNVSQQSSDATQNEEIANEQASEPAEERQPRRRRG